MDPGYKYSSVGKRINAKRQTGERSAALLKDSKRVLAELKNDVDHGVRVDPETVRRIERTISRHQPAHRPPQDLSEKISEIKRLGRRRQQ